jgi:hypothetical protein
MGHLIDSVGEIEALQKWLALILREGLNNGNYLELQNCLLSIEYDKRLWEAFTAFKNPYISVTGAVGEKGWNRATRVYTSTQHRQSKPSYLARLFDYPDQSRRAKKQGINQIDSIVQDLIIKPGYSCLSFVILRPADLIDKFRPGYVPCPIAGDFKFRDKRLDLSVMFRTSDALAVGYADIFYLRELQGQVLNQAIELSNKKALSEATLGSLNLFFSRTYIPKRIKNKDGSSINGLLLSRELIAKINEFSRSNKLSRHGV